MARHTFFCIDGHTCGNPVRVVGGGSIPQLEGETMFERRQHFLAEYDWIRTGLMFEPRGHDVMSGSILYPPTRPDCDVGILFIETSGCLPMCGHGTIGTVTIALENGLIHPKTPGFSAAVILTLAIVDDIGAILVIAVFYTADLALGWLAIALTFFGGWRPQFIVAGALFFATMDVIGTVTAAGSPLLSSTGPCSMWPSMYARAPLFAVADGMGGAQAGEVASRMAAEAFEPAERQGEPAEAFLRADDEAVFAAILAGASGYVLKEDPIEDSIRAIRAASTDSSKSIVPTTRERWSRSATNGVAYDDFSAQP